MAGLTELPQFILDRFIKEIEYNPRLKNYLLQKRIARNANKVNPGESFVAPVNFKENKNYEAYKRRVDKFNREARENNSVAEADAIDAYQKQLAYNNWAKAHDAERAAGLRKQQRDLMMSREMKELALDEMVRRANIERAKKGVEPLNPNLHIDRMFAKNHYAVNNDLSDEYWNADNLVKRNDFYVRKNPFPYRDVGDVHVRDPKTKVGQMVPSSQDYIYRYHTTNAANLPYIFNSGLDPMKGGQGFGKALVNGFRMFRPEDLQEVYTAVRSPDGHIVGYEPFEGQATIRLKIPKKDYLKMDRNDTNPELDNDYRNESHVDDGDVYDMLSSSGKDLTTVQHGGRTDIFSEKIPPKFIDEVYTDDGQWRSPWDFIQEYDCVPNNNCDEWYDAISQYIDEYGDWDYDKLRKMEKRMGR